MSFERDVAPNARYQPQLPLTQLPLILFSCAT